MKKLKSKEIFKIREQYPLIKLTDEEIVQACQYNPFLDATNEQKKFPLVHFFDICSNPDYFSFTCRHILGLNLPPIQAAVIKQLWDYPFPMLIGNRGFGKSFLLGLYCILRATFLQGRKVVIVGAGFRQAKHVFNYAEDIYLRSPILREINRTSKYLDERKAISKTTDRYRLQIGDSTIVALPLGADGQKIRGERANDIIADEFASIPPDIFEIVVKGFGTVSSSPVEKAEDEARRELRMEANKWTAQDELHFQSGIKSNQMIISGTAYFEFNWFFHEWNKYKNIVESRGDMSKLGDIDGIKEKDAVDYRDYCVMRIPYDLLPKGFLDEKTIANSKATQAFGTFIMEFGACFGRDTKGFFKRSLIESCVVKDDKVSSLYFPPDVDSVFYPVVRGNPYRNYVIAVDPASEIDNFAITIIEVHQQHRRIVYCWTINKKIHKQMLKESLTDDIDYYHFCARKIRELRKLFPCDNIVIDKLGGGVAIMEAINTDKLLQDYNGEMLWPTIDDEKPKDTDDFAGSHIIHEINFADYNWTHAANHNMKMDFEHRTLVFPAFDGVSFGLAEMEDMENEAKGKKIDSLENCIEEIEELKYELTTIIHTATPSGREKWDTPETKDPLTQKKGRTRKDRYSALLMANAVAREINPNVSGKTNFKFSEGGFAGNLMKKKDKSEKLYEAPAWFNPKEGGNYTGGCMVGGDGV